MREKKHVITAVVVFVLAVATGVTAYMMGYYGQDQKLTLSKHDFKTENGTCHVKGTVRDFVVECDKNIQHINYLSMKSRYVSYFGPGKDGNKENLEMIVVNLNKVKGSDKNKSNLSFSLTHNDESTTEIILK